MKVYKINRNVTKHDGQQAAKLMKEYLRTNSPKTREEIFNLYDSYMDKYAQKVAKADKSVSYIDFLQSLRLRCWEMLEHIKELKNQVTGRFSVELLKIKPNKNDKMLGFGEDEFFRRNFKRFNKDEIVSDEDFLLSFMDSDEARFFLNNSDLSKQEIKLLNDWAQGYSKEDIAKLNHIKPNNVYYKQSRSIKKIIYKHNLNNFNKNMENRINNFFDGKNLKTPEERLDWLRQTFNQQERKLDWDDYYNLEGLINGMSYKELAEYLRIKPTKIQDRLENSVTKLETL